jgi:hypothetical protein
LTGTFSGEINGQHNVFLFKVVESNEESMDVVINPQLKGLPEVILDTSCSYQVSTNQIIDLVFVTAQ